MTKQASLFLLLAIFFLVSCNSKNDQWVIEEDTNGVLILEGADSVLFYQKATKSLEGEYPRANYIHPVYSLDNTRLTEDFPEDHPHHRGIFWAWHQNFVDDQSVGDAWALEHFSWEVASLNVERNPEACQLRTEVYWTSPLWLNDEGKETPFVKENALINIHVAQANYRIIDFEIEIQPLVDRFYLGGSEDAKGYSGFSWRIPLPQGVSFTSVKGPVTPQTLALDIGPWMDIRGNLDGLSGEEGVVVITDPANPRHPAPWILRRARSMQNVAFPGREKFMITKEQPLILKYRMIVYKNRLDPTLMLTDRP